MNPELLAAIVGGGIGVVGTIVGAMAGYGGSLRILEKKQRAQERDKFEARILEGVRLLNLLCQDYEALVHAKHVNNEDYVHRLPPNCIPLFTAVTSYWFPDLQSTSNELVKTYEELRKRNSADIFRDSNKDTLIKQYRNLVARFRDQLLSMKLTH